MWLTIAKTEMLQIRRVKLFAALAVTTWLLLLVAAAGGFERYRQTRQQQITAGSLFRHEWEEQETNPHSAAHFGTWLFKPVTFLSIADNGLNNFTGISYRVEAHRQHELNYSAMQDTGSQLRFGELSPALVLQLLVPLLIIILAHGSISREKENNTLRLLFVQGGGSLSLLWGKILGNYTVIALLLMPALLLIIAGTWLFTGPALVARSLLFSGAYLVYFFIITGFTILISACCKSTAGSLMINLGAWMFWCIVLPRMAANWADQAVPLPSRYAFNRKIQEGYTKGIGNDGNVMDRRKKYQQQVLKQYNTDSLEKLPVNFDGLVMQYGEDYNSMVYRKVKAETDSLICRQQHWLAATSLIDPFMAIQQVSMGIAGTDYFHHRNYHQEAGLYRDRFIRDLNLELAHKGGAYLSYDYKAGSAYFKNTKPFNWQLPVTGKAVRWHALSWLSLAGWLLLLLLFIAVTAKKMSV